jgi:glutamate-1-semialdehyde 2,1-aminomutase
MKGTKNIMKTSKSQELFNSAKEVIPGGVNSPVRACKSVGTDPLFIQNANGPIITDADGNDYIDYVGSWGPMILGHNHPFVKEALINVLERGTSFGAPTDLETELSKIVIDMVPSIEMVRMVNSGTEATMSAIRLARGVTKRDKIIKFDGCYHGHADALLVEAGSGVATLNIPGSPGVPQSFVEHTLSLPYNDIGSVKKVMEEKGAEIACIILEPVAGNMGMIPPAPGFLEGLREVTEKYGTLLIFDEVMTGFRVAKGCAQGLFNITPDLTCLGKIIGGGLPVGAYGGKKKYMEQMAPVGPVYQAGTLSGNPLAMTAGIATLTKISESGFYDELNKKAEYLVEGLKNALSESGIDGKVGSVGSMFGLFFTNQEVTDFDSAKTSDLDRFAKYYKGMLNEGVYLAPSQFEAGFVSNGHSYEDLDKTIGAALKVMKTL